MQMWDHTVGVADVAPEVVEKDLDYRDANTKSNIPHELR